MFRQAIPTLHQEGRNEKGRLSLSLSTKCIKHHGEHVVRLLPESMKPSILIRWTFSGPPFFRTATPSVWRPLCHSGSGRPGRTPGRTKGHRPVLSIKSKVTRRPQVPLQRDLRFPGRKNRVHFRVVSRREGRKNRSFCLGLRASVPCFQDSFGLKAASLSRGTGEVARHGAFALPQWTRKSGDHWMLDAEVETCGCDL